ncbi:MAG: hypothetical protein ACPLPQ_11170 [Candidatus Saccharicenans sp.]
MKKQFEILGLVIIIFLISVIYRERATPKLVMFPVTENKYNSGKEVMLYLFLFFSKNNCPPCLRVIEILNQPRESISVTGVIPEKELALVDEIRNALQIRFPIKTTKKWKRFLPNYTPTLYGVGRDGRIYFVLPCVGIEEHYLTEYLSEFERKAAYLLLSSKRK